MHVLSTKDYKLFEKLVSLRQSELRKAMIQYLKARYNKVLITKDYIVAIGDIPIALVAHMDTVFAQPVENMFYDERKGVLWSPEGLGADDRAGVFSILKILQENLRPSVILTTDEEKGGIGALALSKIPCPIPDLKYMIELDRRGTNDCVFYDCYVPEFIQYVETFGFCEQWGTFSDISYLMPAWKKCGVNLSVGYQNEHSVSETLHVNPLYDTIKKVSTMLKEEFIPDFEYDELYSKGYGYGYYGCGYGWSSYEDWWTGDRKESADGQHCSLCKKLFMEYELFPMKTSRGGYKFLCPDCINHKAKWCDICGDPFEMAEDQKPEAGKPLLCKDCEDELCTSRETSKKSKNNSKK